VDFVRVYTGNNHDVAILRNANDYKRAYRILAEQGEDGASETTEFADIIEKIRNKKGAGAGGEFAGIFNFQHYAWLQKP